MSWRRSSAGPSCCSCGSDDTDSRARCDCAARSPPVVCRSHISAWADIDVCRAVDIHVGRPVHNVGVPVHDIRLPARHVVVSARDIRSCTDDAGRSADASCVPAMCARPPERAPPRLATSSTSALSGWITAAVAPNGIAASDVAANGDSASPTSAIVMSA